MESNRTKQTFFEHYKKEGNDIMITFESLPEIKTKMQKGQEAISLYEIAFHNATSNEEKAASRKNQGFTSAKIAYYIDNNELESLKIHFIFQAVRFYRESFYFGSGMDEKWKNGLHSNNQSLWKMLTEVLAYSDSEEKIGYYQEFATSVHPDFLVVILSCSYALAKSYFNISTKKVYEESYSAAAQDLNLCRSHYMRYLQAKEHLKNQTIPADFNVSKQNHEEIEFGVKDLQKRIECLNSLKKGREAMENAVKLKITLNMHLVNQALDHLIEGLEIASMLKDIELQAEFQALLGHIYFRIIKNNDKARGYLFFAVSRVHQEPHNHLKAQDWFIDAKKDLSEIQAINNDAHIEFRRQYETEITLIENEFKKKKPAEFIKYIQMNFKPDQWTNLVTDDELKPERIQRTITKIIRYYHPDCANNVDEALDWVYNQITMFLNQFNVQLRNGELKM